MLWFRTFALSGLVGSHCNKGPMREAAPLIHVTAAWVVLWLGILTGVSVGGDFKRAWIPLPRDAQFLISNRVSISFINHSSSTQQSRNNEPARWRGETRELPDLTTSLWESAVLAAMATKMALRTAVPPPMALRMATATSSAVAALSVRSPPPSVHHPLVDF